MKPRIRLAPRHLIFAALAMGALLSVIVFRAVRSWEQRQAINELAFIAGDRVEAIQQTVNDYLGVLRSIGGLYASSHSVESDEFEIFVREPLQRLPAIEALEWLPRVAGAERERFEAAAPTAGDATFQIRDRDAAGALTRAATRPEYFPTFYTEPFQKNRVVWGTDNASDPVRWRAMAQAWDTGQIVATPPLHLFRSPSSTITNGWVVFLPVYHNGTSHDTVETRRDHLAGFVAMVVDLPAMIEDSLRPLRPEGLDIFFFDTAAGRAPFYVHPSRIRAASDPPMDPTARGLTHRIQRSLAGRTWEAQCRPVSAFYAKRRGGTAWIAAALVFCLTVILVQYLLFVSYRRREVEQELVERRRAEAQLHDAYQRLQTTQAQLIQSEKLASIGQLASGIAHELKNPLGIILLSVQFLEKAPDLPVAERQDTLAATTRAAMRADTIIRGLLTFARRTSAQLAPVNVDEIIRASLLLVEKQLSVQNIIIVPTLETGSVLVQADANQLQQVFINLILNAVQAMPQGGRLMLQTAVQTLTALEHGMGRRAEDFFAVGDRVLVCEVTDTGTGIPADQLDKVFDPFFTTKPLGEGTGLGLSVVQSIVDTHRGLINIVSRVGHGTTVRVTLPLAPAASAGPGAAATGRKVT